MENSDRSYLKVDHRLVGICEKATAETFRSLFDIAIELRDVQIEIDPLKGQQVSGVIPFIQSSLEGALSISFPQSTLIQLACRFYREMPNAIGEDRLIGAVSEVTSIIFNIVKEQYNHHGFRFQSTFPMVIKGNSHVIYTTFPMSKLHLSFDCQYGSFSIEAAAAQGSS